MKKFWLEFVKRGMMAAWGGPVILCIVWACLQKAGVVTTIDVNTVIMAVISSLIIAFVAAGISVVHQMEQLPKSMAVLIQMAVLYLDYLILYLLNGWLPVKAIGIFTILFVVGFLIIWAIIYMTTRNIVNKINTQLSNE